MTAPQFSRLLNGRRIGRGKYVAKCPSHADHKPSLSINEGKRGVLVKCMSNGCDTREILTAMGLTYSDLFYDKCTPEVRARTSLHEFRDALECQLGLVLWLGSIQKGKKAYWEAAERRIQGELQAVRCKIEPLKVYQEWRSERWQRMNQRQKESYLEAVWNSLNR